MDGKRPAPDGVPKPSAAPNHRPSKAQRRTSDGGEDTEQGGAFPDFMSLGAPRPKAKLAIPASLPLKQLAKVLQVPPVPEAIVMLPLMTMVFIHKLVYVAA